MEEGVRFLRRTPLYYLSTFSSLSLSETETSGRLCYVPLRVSGTGDLQWFSLFLRLCPNVWTQSLSLSTPPG